MRLYLDTADREIATDLLATGVFRGLTTNPTILRRAGLDVGRVPEVYRWAVDAGCREVFLQAWGPDRPTLAARARQLRELGPEVVVKLPASREGVSVCAELAAEGVPTLLTAVYSPGQAVLAAAAGARYLAPYLGRLNEAGRDGGAEVGAMQEVLTAAGGDTQILLASLRDVPSLVVMARIGVPCFTLSAGLARALFEDDLTAAAVRTFEDDAAHTRASGPGDTPPPPAAGAPGE